MLIRIRCSTCQLPFTTVRALLEHRAEHELAVGDDAGPAALPSRAPTPARALEQAASAPAG